VLVVSTVEVTPPGGSIAVGGTLQLSAIGKTSGGVTVSDRAVRWSSSNAAVASVSSTGLVTGNAIGGPITITATIDRASSQVPVTVTPKPVASVTVEPGQAQVVIGGAVQYTATPRDAQGQPLEGRPVAWESENPAIATVTPTGSAIGVAVGTVAIRATSEGRVGTASLTVLPRPASRLGFTTQPPNGVAGQPLGPVRVAVQDDIGGTIGSATTAITVSLGDNPGGATLGGTLTTSAVQGVATFADLVLNRAAAGYTLRASAAPLSPALSNPFAIASAGATALAITTQPSGTASSGVAFAQQPVVQLRDGLGNAVAQAGVTVTAALVGATGSLGGTVAVTTNASGAATFTNLAITAPAGAYTIRFTSAGLTEIVSAPITVGAGSAARLTVTTQPSSGAQSGVPFGQQPVVQLQDGSGNPVAQAGIAITASVSAGGTLGGTATVLTNASGAAVFTGLSISGPAGNYTLTFASPGLTGVTSAAITLGAGGSAGLQIVTQPSAAGSSGVPLSTQPVVRLVDGAGNPVSQAGVLITASVTGGGAVVTAGATATTGADGVATFSGLAITGVAGSYTLPFTAPGLAGVTSATISLGAGAPVGLAMARQPSVSAQSGVAFAVQPQVRVVDGSGNAVGAAGIVVTAALASGPGTLGGTLTATTDVSGLATFTNLAVTGSSGTYTIRFTAPGLTQVVSGIIGVGAGVATQLTITTQPAAAAQSGIALTTQPVIQLRDGSNNPVAQAGVAVTAAIATGGGTLSGTVTVNTDASGVATFTDLVISGLVGDRTLEFTATGLASVTSANITLSAGTAARLAITTQPSATAVNTQAFAQQPVIQVQDAVGNPVAASGVVVNAAIATGSPSLAGTPAVTNASGVATFTDLAITGPIGARTLEFTAPGLTPATSGPVTLTAGAATKLAITTQPSSTAQSGVAFPQQPALQLQDVSGNAVAQAGVTVTATPSAGALGGTPTAATDASGTATFAGLSITGPAGSYTLDFTAPGLAGVTSATITLGAGAATQLTITTQPPVSVQSGVAFGTAPVVQLRDGSSNPVAQAGVAVTVAIASGGGTPGGTLTQSTDAAGQATFPGLSITGIVGTRTLQFTAAGLTATTSNSISVTAGPAAELGMAVQPPPTAQSGVALSPPPQVQVRDAAGNNVAASGVAITASIATGTGGSLTNTIAVTSATGVATFTGLTLSGTSGNFTLLFSATGLADTVSSTIALGAGSPSVLAITTQPSPTVQNGVAFPQQPVVQLRDAANNPVAQAGVPVSVTILTGDPALTGTTTVNTDASGQAAFPNLEITGATGDRVLIFAAPGYVGVSSNTVTVNAGPAAALEMVNQPSVNAQSGIALSPQPSVRLVDESGNAVGVPGVSVSATLNGGGSLTGGPATTDGSGVATFTDLVITGTAGVRTLSFASGGLTGTTSDNINLTAGAASQLTLTTPPPGTAQSGAALTTQPAVQLRDGAGNPVSQAGATVTAVIATSPGGTPTLGSATATTDANGLATFSGLAIAGTTGNYTLRFDSGTLTSVTSATITLSAGAASQLTLTTPPPATATNTIALTTQPVVQLRDAGGNAVSQAGVLVTAVIATGPAGTTSLTNATATTNASGVATFSGLAITGPTGDYTLRFDSGTLTSVTSGTITLSAGPAATLTIETEPAGPAQSGVALPTQPVIRVRDASGNTVGGTTVTAANTPGSGQPGATLGGTTSLASASNGRATFTNLAITGLADTDYTLTFSATGPTPVVSGPIQITPGAAARLALTTPVPSPVTNDVVFSPAPVVQVQDAAGNPVAQSGTTVTAAIATGAGTLGGTLSATTDAGGAATFGNLKITGLVGDRTLSFSATGLTSVTSGTVTVQAGAATTIAANSTLTQNGTAGANVAAPPSVLVTDVSGNPVSGVSVTFAVTAGGGSVNPVTAVVTGTNGLATLTSWTLGTTAGPNTVTATAGTLTGSPVTFNATATAGSATTIAFNSATAQSDTAGLPVAAPPSVLVTDGNGNPVSGIDVVFTVTAGGGSISPASPATVATNASGIATLTSWALGAAAGTNTVTATAAGLSGSPVTFNATGVAGAPTTIAANSPTSIGAPAGTSVAVGDRPSARVTDANGNGVSGVNVTFTVTGGGGTISPASPAVIATDGSGVATLGDWTLGASAGVNTVTAASGTLSGSPVTYTATGTAGSATQLVVITQPSATARSGLALATVPVVQARDAGNNPVSGVTINAALNGGGTPSGTVNGVTDGSGNVSFTGLTITGTAGTKSFTFSSGALPTATSTDIALGAGAASQLVLTTQPGGAANGAALSPQPVVQVRDAQGNALDTTLTVTATIASSPGGTPGLTGATASTGGGNSATFSGLTITGLAGSYTLTFSAGSLTAATSNALTLTAGTPSGISFQTAPGGSAQSGVALSTQPVVRVVDQTGNGVGGVTVTASLLTGTGATSGGNSVLTDGNGDATFSSLVIDGSAGTITLRFTGGSLTLDSGNITLGAGPATQLAITTQPVGAASGAPLGTQPVVEFRDSGGNLVSTTASVSVALVGPGGTPGGTTTISAVGGIATFTDLTVTGAGTYQLQFTSAGVTSALSVTITITP
jgi:hypothetical protein